MKNTVTRVDALNYAIAAVTNSTEILTDPNEIVEVLTKIRDQIAARKTSDATKAKQIAKRAEARNGIVTEVAPIVFRAVTTEPSTAKEIFERCEGLPEDFTAPKVQYLLLHELATKVIKTEAKGKPNTYHRI